MISRWLLRLRSWVFASGLMFSVGCGVTSLGNGDRDGGTGDGGFGVHDGLPCDVATLLQSRCDACHGSPAMAAPMSIVSYADLLKPAPSNAAKTVAQAALDRMQNAAAPMPPGGLLAPSEIAVLQAWITAGEPKGSCATAGSPDAGPPVCTSGNYYTRGTNPSMHPGRSCNGCHGDSDGPIYTVAGTVYPTLHEPADCIGDLGATVVVTDQQGTTLSLPTTASGNFASEQPLTFPIKIKVTAGGRTREMASAPSSGDCNSCHTQDGTQGAPGRIQAP